METKILIKSSRSDSRLHFKNIETRLKCKRSQHEAMGFVVIVALVIIVGVIFLGIKMNQNNQVQEYSDAKIINFVTASSRYNSDCIENHEPLTLNDLKEKCYKKEACRINGVDRSSCDVLKETYSDMLNKSWPIFQDSAIRYYELEIYYRTTCNETGTKMSIVSDSGGFIIASGNLSSCRGVGKKTGQESFISSDYGRCIITELDVCEADK